MFLRQAFDLTLAYLPKDSRLPELQDDCDAEAPLETALFKDELSTVAQEVLQILRSSMKRKQRDDKENLPINIIQLQVEQSINNLIHSFSSTFLQIAVQTVLFRWVLVTGSFLTFGYSIPALVVPLSVSQRTGSVYIDGTTFLPPILEADLGDYWVGASRSGPEISSSTMFPTTELAQKCINLSILRRSFLIKLPDIDITLPGAFAQLSPEHQLCLETLGDAAMKLIEDQGVQELKRNGCQFLRGNNMNVTRAALELDFQKAPYGYNPKKPANALEMLVGAIVYHKREDNGLMDWYRAVSIPLKYANRLVDNLSY
ncbi:hypothetical protein C8J56DRAFT_1111439 [Mycena floridula]|nr:hypothetical protein C8J56DRAFT_1111439 [Mycena floridula]